MTDSLWGGLAERLAAFSNARTIHSTVAVNSGGQTLTLDDRCVFVLISNDDVSPCWLNLTGSPTTNAIPLVPEGAPLPLDVVPGQTLGFRTGMGNNATIRVAQLLAADP